MGTASPSRVKPPLRVSRRASSSGHSAVSRPQPVQSQLSLVSHTAASQDSRGAPRRVRQRGVSLGVRIRRREPSLPAQYAGSADMEQQGLPAPGLLGQVELCGEDADGLLVPGHLHGRSPPNLVCPACGVYSSSG